MKRLTPGKSVVGTENRVVVYLTWQLLETATSHAASIAFSGSGSPLKLHHQVDDGTLLLMAGFNEAEVGNEGVTCANSWLRTGPGSVKRPVGLMMTRP
jgi:hypothetical protein